MDSAWSSGEVGQGSRWAEPNNPSSTLAPVQPGPPGGVHGRGLAETTCQYGALLGPGVGAEPARTSANSHLSLGNGGWHHRDCMLVLYLW